LVLRHKLQQPHTFAVIFSDKKQANEALISHSSSKKYHVKSAKHEVTRSARRQWTFEDIFQLEKRHTLCLPYSTTTWFARSSSQTEERSSKTQTEKSKNKHYPCAYFSMTQHMFQCHYGTIIVLCVRYCLHKM